MTNVEWLEKENRDYRKQLKAMNEYCDYLHDQSEDYKALLEIALKLLDAMTTDKKKYSANRVKKFREQLLAEYAEIAARERPLIVK